MSIATLGVLGLGFSLAYANGANDVSKGIATLVGSGVTDYRRAILWGAAWTAAGGLLGAVLAKAMVAAFGSGFLTAGTTPTLMAATATLIGAGAWVLIATGTGLPVSTTHAIVGSIAGVAVAAYGVAGLHWSAIGGKILIPLLISPVASFLVVTLTVALKEIDRAVLDGEEEGFATVHADKKSGRILGATLVAAHAGEMIAEMSLAMTAGLSLASVAKTLHPYPTQAEVWKRLGDAWSRTRLTPRVRGWFECFLRWRRYGFFVLQAQWPALISAAMRSGIVDRPVAWTSARTSARVNSKQ